MTVWVLHTLVCIHTHTHTHTHTQTHTLVLEALGEISAKAKIPGCPNVWTLSCLKIIIQLRKIHEVTIISKNVLGGRYTTTIRPMKK
jgi:hypothetical protein